MEAAPVMIHSSTFLLPPQPTGEDGGPALTYALVVLNQPLPHFFPRLWEHARLRLCADGGANRLHDELPAMFRGEVPLDVRRSRDAKVASQDRRQYKPNVIIGDMDSITPEVKNFYTELRVEIVDEAHDQDTTDLHKCVSYIRDYTAESERSNLCILVAGALGGRFDHEAGNINILCQFSSIRIVLLSDDCLIYLLPRTHSHDIHIQSLVEGLHCGLVPIGGPSISTTTTGLQWDLSDTGMSFGGLISTSNKVRENKITVHSDSDLLWTISIQRTNTSDDNIKVRDPEGNGGDLVENAEMTCKE